MENVLIVNPVVNKGDIYDQMTLKITHAKSIINCLSVPYDDDNFSKISDREVSNILSAVEFILDDITTLIYAFLEKDS